MTLLDQLTDRYAVNGDVRLHYMAGGSGPLVVLVHGFPDFWYTWHHQIEGLMATHSVAAMDCRGYNLSDAPDAVEAYSLDHLVDDVAAVIANEGRASATIVGHDWGGGTAWAFAQRYPELTDGLIIVNVPHPSALAAELQRPGSPQPAAFGYTDEFRQPGSGASFDAEGIARSVARDPVDHLHYVEAFERTNVETLMNYYRQGPVEARASNQQSAVSVPVLQFHGMEDPVLLASSLNNTWDHLSANWQLVTIPGAGHWPHHDAPEFVTYTMVHWLQRQALGLPVPDAPQRPETVSVGDGAPAVQGCCQ